MIPFGGGPMKINQAGIDLIKKFEGCRLMAYKDGGGVLTIGFGSTVDVEPGQLITMAEAEDRLKADLADAEKCVNEAVQVQLTDNEFSALVCLVFNIGCHAFQHSTLLRLLNEESDFDGAAREFRRWDKDNGKVVDGLLRRRYAESKLFETA